MPKLFFINDIKKSNTSCEYFDGEKKYIATADLQNGEIVNYELVDYNNKPSRANLISEIGSVVFAKMQNTIKVLEINESNYCNIYSTGFYSFKDARVLPKYLRFFFESSMFNTMKDKNCQGATMKAINDEGMSKISINVPTIEVQQKIISELSQITDLINSNKNNLMYLDNIVKSQFIEMFGDPISNEKGWKVKELNEVTDVRDGTHDSPKYYNSGYPFVTSKNLINGIIDFSTCNLICEEDYLHFNDRSNVDDGDILMPMIGTIGGAIIVNKYRDFAIKNVALIKFNKNNDIINRTFVHNILNSDSMNQYFNIVKKGGTQNFISLGLIRKIPTILPPIELQNKFASFVQQIDKSKYIKSNTYI